MRVYLVVERQLIAYSIRRWARNGTMERRAVIVGGGEPAKELIRALERQPDNDIRICGIFDDRDERRSPSIVAGYPKLGTIAELVEFARLARIDMLIISLPLSAEDAHPALLKQALGAAGRHPPCGAFQRPALPAAQLFAGRQRPASRHLRQADRRLGFGGKARLRHRSSACWRCCCCGRSSSARPSPSS